MSGKKLEAITTILYKICDLNHRIHKAEGAFKGLQRRGGDQVAIDLSGLVVRINEEIFDLLDVPRTEEARRKCQGILRCEQWAEPSYDNLRERILRIENEVIGMRVPLN